jgi:hypothetical protein
MKEETKINYTDVDSLFTYTGTDTSEEFYKDFLKSFLEIMKETFPKGNYWNRVEDGFTEHFYDVNIFGNISTEFMLVKRQKNILLSNWNHDGISGVNFSMVIAGPEPYENETYGS